MLSPFNVISRMSTQQVTRERILNEARLNKRIKRARARHELAHLVMGTIFLVDINVCFSFPHTAVKEGTSPFRTLPLFLFFLP